MDMKYDMAIYHVTFDWTQDVRDQVAQDESVYVGTRQVRSVANVVAPSEALAVRAVLDGFRTHRPELVSTTRSDLYGIVHTLGMERLSETRVLSGVKPRT